MRAIPVLLLAVMACSSSATDGPNPPATGTYRVAWSFQGSAIPIEYDTVTMIVSTSSSTGITGSVSGGVAVAGAIGDGSWQLSAYRITMPLTYSPTAIVRTTFDGTCTGNVLYSDFRSYTFASCTVTKL